MKDLRKIIVDATSEMLDEPGENGIYKTTRFYDRLESEVQEYIQIHPDPIYKLIMATVEHSADIDPDLQRMIAKYLDYQSHPVTFSKQVATRLFGKDTE